MSLCWSDVHEDEATVGEAELRERIERSRIVESEVLPSDGSDVFLGAVGS